MAPILRCEAQTAQTQTKVEAGTTVSAYLDAWAYRDFATMYALSTPEVRSSLSESQFFTAAGKLPSPASEPVVTRESSAIGSDGKLVYIEYQPTGGSERVRTSLQVGAQGIKHSELLSQAPAAAPASSGTNTAAEAPAQTVDGQTVEQVLDQMTSATASANTLKADVAVQGNVMGQQITEKGVLLYKAPNKMKMDLGRIVMAADGNNSTLYLADMNVYMDLASLGGDFELSPGFGTTGAELKKKYQISLVGKNEVNGESAYELVLRPSSQSLGGLGAMMGGMAKSSLRLWVDADTYLPIRGRMDNFTVDYNNVQVNVDNVTDSDFQFTPPSGAQPLNLGGMLGGGGAGSMPRME